MESVSFFNLISILLVLFCSLHPTISFTSPNQAHSQSYGSTRPIRLRQNQVLLRTSSSQTFINTKMNMAEAPKETSIASISKVIAKIGTSTSTVVAGAFFLALAYQRDSFMLTFFTGSILNSISSKVLKKVLNVKRPEGYEGKGVQPLDGGMPSSHAMSLGFICTYCIIQAFSLFGNEIQTIAISLGLVLYATVSLIYRVQCKLHTMDQIIVGLVFGITNSFIWHSLAFGKNLILPGVNIMELVSALLPESGIMPIQYLAIPALFGAAVVGSFERRFSEWLSSKKAKAS